MMKPASTRLVARSLVAVALASLLLGATACGGGDDSGASSSGGASSGGASSGGTSSGGASSGGTSSGGTSSGGASSGGSAGTSSGGTAGAAGAASGGGGGSSGTGGGTANPRFPGDPGAGNLYVGFITKNGDMSLEQGEETTLSKIDYGSGTNARPTGIVRLYNSGFAWSFNKIDPYLNAGKLVWYSFKPTGASEAAKSTFMAEIAAGQHDTELSSWATEIKSRAPKVIWYTFHHEPENDYGANTTSDTTSKQNYRAATRYIYQFFKSHGVTNLANISTVFMQSTFNTPNRPWYHYYPDWKGTGYSGGYNTPNLSDFYSGSESVVDAIGFDSYCFHGNGGAGNAACSANLYSWSQSTYESHDMHQNDASKHARKLFDTLSGFNKAFAIGEWGYHLYSPGGAVDAAESQQQFHHVYQDFVGEGVVGVVHWMAVAQPGDNYNYEFGMKCDGTADPTDARRKGFAWWLDQPTTVTPSWAP
jgi:hypothetical protein